jgi:hypothetical protein
MNNKSEKNLMNKHFFTFFSLSLLLFLLVASVHASVSVESTVGDNIFVVYNFENLDPAVYNETIANPQLFNSSTIPQIIVKNLENQGLTNVNYGVQPNVQDFATKTIRVSFYLGGSDIMGFTVNRTTMNRDYQVKTEWRNFQVNLTSSFSINFAQYFAESVEEWQKTNPTTFYIETHGTDFFDKVSFKLTLPATATNVQAQGNTITYELSPSFEDILLGSPFLILAALIIIVAIVLIYRRIK